MRMSLPDLVRRARILVSDDSESSLRVIAACLEDLGYDVFTAENNQVALDMLDAADPDLVLMDYNSFGYIKGLDACRKIKERRPWTKVVGFSGESDLAPAYRARGAEGFMKRPLELEKFDRIADVLGGKTYFEE